MADIKAEYLACPIRQVISRFGDKWSMLVLYMLHTSETGVLRFNEIRRLMTDCSQKMLSATLKNLEQSHLVHREVYPEVPPRVEYSLTETGRSLMPAIIALIDWGKEHFDEFIEDVTNADIERRVEPCSREAGRDRARSPGSDSCPQRPAAATHNPGQ